MAAGESSQTGIVDGSCNMPPKWEGGRYRITAEASLKESSSDELGQTDNNKKTLEIEVPWAKLTDVTFMSVTGNNYQGECSSNKNMTFLEAEIDGNVYGIIKYHWVIDGVPSTSVSELTYHVDDIIDRSGCRYHSTSKQDRNGGD